ncbi:MAG: 30S ribosomal protein S20 [Candidatus Moranbacteria bacterium]|jgi:small subunit ribosomal protein S20|nr:30S ribosomal protein S20 [Candidatus Moranbacteria bacterium]
MPIKESAKKYMRVTDRKTAKNKKVRGTYRSAIKKTREAVAQKDLAKATEWLKKTIKTLDKAIEKKVIKKNTGARYKSRINKMVKNMSEK